MRKAWCKLWNLILNTFSDAVSAVAYALKTVGDVVVEILGAAAEAVGSAVGSIFGGSNLLVWIGVGVFAYMLLTKKDESGSRSLNVDAYREYKNAT